MKRSQWLLVLCSLAVLGCTWGPTVEELRPALSPQGDVVHLWADPEPMRIEGELIAADAEMVAIATNVLQIVPWRDVRHLRLVGYQRSFYPRSTPLVAADLQLIRALSRFPEGLDSVRAAAVRRSLSGK